MTAQIDFNRRSEPTKVKVVASRNEKSCFGEIVFGSNSLKDFIVWPLIMGTTAAGLPEKKP